MKRNEVISKHEQMRFSVDRMMKHLTIKGNSLAFLVLLICAGISDVEERHRANQNWSQGPKHRRRFDNNLVTWTVLFSYLDGTTRLLSFTKVEVQRAVLEYAVLMLPDFPLETLATLALDEMLFSQHLGGDFELSIPYRELTVVTSVPVELS
jgi:hypothetical protein